MFRICSRINYFDVYALYCNQGLNDSLYDSLLDSMARIEYSQLMLNLSLLVMPMLITLSGYSRSLLLIGMDVLILIFPIGRVVSSWYAVPLTLLLTDPIL